MAIDKTWLQNVINSGIPQRNEMIVSQKYYNSENTAIMERQKLIPVVGGTGTMTDPYKSNVKLPSGFHKILIEQKVNFSLNAKMSAVIGEGDNAKDISDVLGTKWNTDVQSAGREASKNGFAVWQMYLDGSETKYKAIPSEQITLCFDGDRNVVYVVRQYEALDEETGETITIAEVWNDTEHWEFKNRDGKEWDCTKNDYHLVTQSTLGGQVVEEDGKGWGRVPFAIFLNNEECLTDLKQTKPFIDAYDYANSDFANNLQDFEEAFWSLKNFDGQDIGEFFDNVKKYKAIKVGDEGDATMHTQEIPHEAKTTFMSNARSNVYEFGMGVDTKSLGTSGAVTATEIESMYENLNLKANTFENNCDTFLKQALFFYDVDPEDLVTAYDRSIIVNQGEKIDLLNKSVGIVSDETIYKEHPWVDDIELEIERMEPVKASALDGDDTDE